MTEQLSLATKIQNVLLPDKREVHKEIVLMPSLHPQLPALPVGMKVPDTWVSHPGKRRPQT